MLMPVFNTFVKSVTLIGAASANCVSPPQIDVTLPVGSAVGDLCLLMYSADTDTATDYFSSFSAGFADVKINTRYTSGAGWMGSGYKILDGTDITNGFVSLILTGYCDYYSAGVFVVRGASTVALVEHSDTNIASATISIPTISSVRGRAYVAHFSKGTWAPITTITTIYKDLLTSKNSYDQLAGDDSYSSITVAAFRENSSTIVTGDYITLSGAGDSGVDVYEIY
jgi:hypothetical protein